MGGPTGERRRALRDAYKRGERERQRSLLILSRPQLERLLDYLDPLIGERGCDGTLRGAMAWAEWEGVRQEALRTSLHDLGGGCDCEVVLNVDPDELF
jgi:hypothetical protein